MKTSVPSLKQLAAAQIFVGALLAGGAGWIWGFQLGASIAIGAALMMGNMLILGWSWRRLFDKKSIAWTVLIIVIKYAVLLGSIFYLGRTKWFNPLGAGIGISSFMLAALVLAAFYYKKETSEIDSL